LVTPARPTAAPPAQMNLGAAAADPALGKLSAHVTDLATGQVLFAQDEGKPLVPASATKLTTLAASTLTLPRDHRLATRVLQNSPEELVIRGEGDVTLEKSPGSGFFTGPASVQDLAQQVRRSLGADVGKIKRITVDNSVRESALFSPTWDRKDIGGGNVTNLDAVMLDAGRLDPSDSYSPRSEHPGQDVAANLADQLGLSGVDTGVTDGGQAAGGSGGREVAKVESAPLSVRQRDMMVHSDNLLAEAIGREIAAAAGKPATFDGATQATLEILRSHGVDTEGAVLKDNSGMSGDDRLTARTLDSILANTDLRGKLEELPVAHAEGTLLTRFGQGSGAEDAAGRVRAKTGTLSGVNALAGSVTTKSGRPVSFAFLSNASEADSARPALDRLAAALYRQ
ncbi:D-alanyl-D-alanine carboxypeptidase/D-alanyl-D-alanine endopeptidase, partial [Corynebacterium heidelbergense]